MNTSDSWIDITSSNVDNSAYRIYDTSYLFSSNNNGSITLNNFIKFYSDSYDYKLRVVDDNNINIYGEIIYYVRNSSFNSNNTNNFPVSVSSAYRFGGVLDAAVPSLNSNFDVKLYVRDLSNRSVIDYNRTVTISLERKSLA